MADFETNDKIGIAARMWYDGAYSIVNQYYVNLDAGGPLQFSQIQLAIQNYLDSLYGNLTTLLVSRITVDSIGVRNETQATVFGSMSWGSWTGGSNAGDPSPLGVCCLAFGRTFKARVQVRKYFGVFPDTELTLGLWAGTTRGACANALTYHISQQTPDTGITFTGGAFNRTLKTMTYATSVTTSEEPAYQRRRKRGRGS